MVPEIVLLGLPAIFVVSGIKLDSCSLDLLTVPVTIGSAFMDACPGFVVGEVIDNCPPAIVTCCDCGVVDPPVLLPCDTGFSRDNCTVFVPVG